MVYTYIIKAGGVLMNKYLDKGYCLEIGNKVYTIIAHTASGSSCAVYEAECDGSTYIIKECCPVFLDFNRSENGSILVSDDKIKKFDYYKEQFKNSYKREKSVREIPGLMNSTPHVNGIVNSNNTLYYSVIKFEGKEFSEVIKEENILECIKAYKSIANLAQKYHAHGYLMLDIKPENILILPETKELTVYVDYDSIMKKEEIEFGNSLSYTHNWAAPEQKNPYSYKKISEKTDVFAVGEMLFFTLFGRHSNDYDHRGFSRYDYDKSRFAMEICNRPKTKKILTDIFHNTIRSVADNRCSMQDLVEKLGILINELEKKQYIISTSIDTINNFIGRESELEAIDSKFNDNKIVFIYGIAGVGKSEIARRYYDKSNYDTKMFCTFNCNLETTICSETGINIVEFYRDENEKNFDFAKRKLSKLNELLTENSLLVIDNLDTKIADVNQEIWSMISSLPCRILIASRNEPNKEYAAISIESMSTDYLGALYNSICPFNDESKSAVNTIIENLYNNALLVKLIASQAKDKGERPEEMCKELEDNGITSFSKDGVELRKDSMVTTDTIANYLDKLFGFSNMSEEQILTLAEAAFMPENIKKKIFIAFMDIEDTEPLKYLISLGWISEINYRINVHPLIKKLVISKLKNDNEKVIKLFWAFNIPLIKGMDYPILKFIIANYFDEGYDTYNNSFYYDHSIINIRTVHYLLKCILNGIIKYHLGTQGTIIFLMNYYLFYYDYLDEETILTISQFISDWEKDDTGDIIKEIYPTIRELYSVINFLLLLRNGIDNQSFIEKEGIVIKNILKSYYRNAKKNNFISIKRCILFYLSIINEMINNRTSFFYKCKDYWLDIYSGIVLLLCKKNKSLKIGSAINFCYYMYLHVVKQLAPTIGINYEKNRKVLNYFINTNVRLEVDDYPNIRGKKLFQERSDKWTPKYLFLYYYFRAFSPINLEEGKKYLDLAITTYETGDVIETKDVFDIYINRAEIAFHENDYNKSKELYQKCRELNDILNLHKENYLNQKLQEIDEKLNNN